MTDAELIGTSYYVPFSIWMDTFLEAKGYDIKNNIILQDNKSTIRMSKNGRDSCIVNSRHINIRHFFVNYGVEKGEIEVNYCPTHIMVTD